MAVVTPLNNFLGPEGDTVTVDKQLLNTEYCGQGALLVAQATATHMPCELWLHYCIEKYAPRMGRSGRHSGCAQHSLQCSTILCSERERPEDSSMSGPMHFAILAHYSRMRHSHTN